MRTPATLPGRDATAGIRRYYSEILRSSEDLKTGACCAPADLPPMLRDVEQRIHPEVRERFYGCGAPLPPALAGATVLDLGCGAGRDAYLLSQLVGPRGRVIGVDMTPEQLEVAERHRPWHAKQFDQPRSSGSVGIAHGCSPIPGTLPTSR